MNYSSYLVHALATAARTDAEDAAETSAERTDLLEPALRRIHALVECLRQDPLSPLAAAQFDKDLWQATRELGRGVV